MKASPSEAPIACSLNAAGQTARRAAWERLGKRSLREPQMTERGVRLVFARKPGVQDELRELARLEGECCAFAEWRVEDHGDRLVLDVSADTAGAHLIVAATAVLSTEPKSSRPPVMPGTCESTASTPRSLSPAGVAPDGHRENGR